MKATIVRTYTFEAAHFLPNVATDHKCGRMHGHSYEVRVGVYGNVLGGWVMDFADVDAVAKPIIDALDHRTLNDFIDNPTSEMLAGYLLGQIYFATWIEVSETSRSYVRVER